MTHTVALSQFPATADPLAALFVASRKEPVSGKKGQTERAKLARILSAGPVADLFKGMESIQVRPRSRPSGLTCQRVRSRTGGERDAAIVVIQGRTDTDTC